MRKLKVFLAGVLAFAALGRPVPATTVVALDDAQLVHLARTIVHADVIGKQAYVADATGRIYTEYFFRPHELLKGEAGKDGLVVFREWGGEVNGVHYWLPGVGEFGEGEEVVAFLGDPDPKSGVSFTTGLSQGKFHIERDAAGNVRAVRNTGDLHLVDPSTGKLVDEGSPRKAVSVDLSELEKMIRENLAK